MSRFVLLWLILRSKIIMYNQNEKNTLEKVLSDSNNKISVIAVCLLIPFLGMAQGKVTRSTQNHVPNPEPAAVSIKLAADLDGFMKYYSVSEWNKTPLTDKVRHNKVGIVIKYGKEEFLLSLYNNMENGICNKTVSFDVAKNKTGGNLPSKKQLQIVRNNSRAISKASNDFGGDHLCSNKYWCEDGSLIDLNNDGSSSESNGMFRFATNVIDTFYKLPTYSPSNVQECNYISTSSGELKVARFKSKYGILDNSNGIVTSFKYDAIGCNYNWFEHKNGNDEMPIDDSLNLISVSQNGKWGVINREGKEIIPLLYDAVQDYSFRKELCWVKKEGRYGAIDESGNLIIPIVYETEFRFYNHQPAKVKKDGKWGFIDEDGKIVIPFKYSSTRGFGYDGYLAPVSLDSKYGFIDKKGNVIIPLQYEFTDEFSSNLAGVVLNGKIGFIDETGQLVIPCIYDLEYSSDGDGKKLGMSFYGRVAMVKKNGMYGMINKKGDNVTPFKYNRVSRFSSNGKFTVHIGTQTIYLDEGGMNIRQMWNEKQKAIRF